MTAAFLSAFLNGNFIDGHGFHGDIHITGLHSCDLIDDVESFDDFAKDGVVAVKMGSAAHGLVSLTLCGAEDLAQTFFINLEFLVVEDLSLDDVEL